MQDSLFDLLLARLIALETELSALRERVAELEADLHEAWMGGTD